MAKSKRPANKKTAQSKGAIQQPRQGGGATASRPRSMPPPKQGQGQKPRPKQVRSVRKKRRKQRLNPGAFLLRLLLLGLAALVTGIASLASLIAGLFMGLEPRARKAAAAGGFILLAMLAFLLIIFITSRPNAFQINIDDNFVGIVEMRRQPDLTDADVSEMVVAWLENEIGEPVQIFNNITVLPVRSRDVRALDRVVSDIAVQSTYRIQMGIIVVDGLEKAIVRNESEAERLLREIRESFVHEEWTTVIFNDFLEHVEIVLGFRDVASRMTFTHAMNVLTQHDIVEDVHIVAPGDNLTRIRNFYGMSEAAILEINPGIRPDLLSLGQQINVLRPRPLLTVRTIVQLVSEEVVPFGQLEFPSESHPAGYRNTVAPGEDGLRVVTEHLVYENGNLVRRERIGGYTYLVEPRPEQIVVGTGR